MTHRYFFTFALILFSYVLSAQQSPVWDWETHCGNSGSDKALDLAVSSDGYVYTCGFFNGTGTFDTITTGSGGYSKDAFLAKQDMNGNYIWVRYVNSGLDDRALGVHVDKDNNILITGTFWTGMQVGPYYLQGSADSPFIIKYDPAGNLMWAITGGGNGDDHGFDMVTDNSGDIYLTGFLSTHYGPPTCTATFGNLPQFSYSDSIAFLAKISSTGTWQWVRTFDGTDVERDNDIAIDNQGGIYVAGGFYGTNNNFGPFQMSSVSGSRDIFVIKYDSNGNFQWANQVGGYRDDRANGITFGADGYLYVCGEFRAEIYFDGDTLNNNGGPGGKDIFVAKMDINGGWKWASKAGSDDGGETARAITATNQHCIFITGQVNGANVAFGDSISLNTGTDGIQVFAAGIDTAGHWRWAVQAGGPDEDRGYGIDADNECRLYFTGYYSWPSATFGPFTDTVYGLKDGFTVRLDVTCFNYTSDSLVNVPEANTGCTPLVQSCLSPNSDIDYVTIRNGECLGEGTWTIYNLWGQVVFSTTDLQRQWRGTDSKGSYLPGGTYYYVIESAENTGGRFTGSIQVIR